MLRPMRVGLRGGVTAFAGLLMLSACADKAVLVQGASSPTTAAATPSPLQERDGVPDEFRAACGRPGAEVNTERLRVVIQRADCDLTGVVIRNQGRGVTVPELGGVSSSSGVDVVVDKEGVVTFTAEADVPQY